MNKNVMDFGKYKGESMKSVYKKDPSYIYWAIKQNIEPVVSWSKTVIYNPINTESARGITTTDTIAKHSDMVGGYNDFNGSVHPYVFGMGHDY